MTLGKTTIVKMVGSKCGVGRLVCVLCAQTIVSSGCMQTTRATSCTVDPSAPTRL